MITIFSQYGEIMDINMPRDKETGKPRGFSFLMYEDQRSTILAVDNMNGAKVLERTLRVDHVAAYKQPKEKGEDGEWIEPEEQSLNAAPKVVNGEYAMTALLQVSSSQNGRPRSMYRLSNLLPLRQSSFRRRLDRSRRPYGLLPATAAQRAQSKVLNKQG